MMKERPLKSTGTSQGASERRGRKAQGSLGKSQGRARGRRRRLNRVASCPSRWQFLRGSNTRKRMNPSAASAVPLLKAKALTREFDEGQVKALRGVDFSINEGEFVAIAGPSGCGKSTLLQLLGALDRPTSGELFYRGESVPDNPDPAAYRASEIRIHLPGFSSVADFHRARERAAPDVRELLLAFRTARARARVAEAGRPRGSARIISLPSFPAASASGLRSRGVWPTDHLSCWPMNRPAISTVITPTRFLISSLACNRNRAAPWCWSLMTHQLPSGREEFFV